MRKRMKSLLAVVLAFVLVFSLAMPGFAAVGGGFEGDSGVYVDEITDAAMPSDLPTT
ncbi:MAG: hypothetical protein FWE20_09765 [Defluviitaleaceae bacterium]|nr:hypothetical protein [Defluviitaleaceae bacterium]